MRTSNSLGQTSLRRFQRASLLAALLPAISSPFVLSSIEAAQLKEARVSQVIRDVKLLPAQAAPRPATVSDEVRDGTAVRTGVESRAELTFTDQTLARLGANTIFSFNEGTRNLELSGGAMLLRVPKDAGGARIKTAAVTAAITGTTVLLEYHPDAYIKFIILEGTGRIFRNDRVGESVLLHAGQMLIVNPKGKDLPDPVDVDLDRLIKTSLLINGFRPLPSDSLIAREIKEQLARKNGGELVATNLVIFGRGTLVSLLDPTHSDILDQANNNETRETRESPTPTPTATPTPTVTQTPTPTPTVTITPTPTPGKSGTPPVITSPDPYVITSGTTIQTDPTITTGGRTDLGTIYHGTEIDGPASTFLFGSTSAFDSSSGFDSHFGDSSNSPMAVFKFSSLVLAGNPTISLSNGGVTNLGLISVGDLTSGTAPATLTFAGIDSLLLATQNGSITLGSNLVFQGIPTLFIYARGAGQLLTFDSTVTGSTNFVLLSQGGILFNNSLDLTETDPSGSSLNVYFDAGKNLTATNGLSLTLDNSEGGDLSGFAEISISAGGNLIARGDSGLSLTITNNDGGTIGSDANIGVFAQGNLTASAVNLLIDNGNGGSIGAFAGLTFEVGGTLTTTGDASFIINNGDAGGTIGSSATLELDAASMSIGGNLEAIIGNNDGGSMLSSLLSIDSVGSITIGGAADFILDNSAFSSSGYLVGGDIAEDAVISLSAGSISTQDGGVITFILNDGGGHIGGDALITAGISGNINAQGDVFFDIENAADTDNDEGILAGGTIDGDAIVTITVGGNLTSTGLVEFSVLNNDNRFLSAGGTILGTAAVTLNAGSISTGDFFNLLVNDNYGTIGGDASVIGNLSGNLTTGTQAYIHLLNDFGNIGGDASVVFGGGAITIGDALYFLISNQSGVIGGDATLDFVAGSLTADSILADILNLNGTIGGDTTISFIVNGALTTTGDAIFEIEQNPLLLDAAAPGEQSILVSTGSINVGGSLFVGIAGNETIGETSNVLLTSTGNITVGDYISVYGTLHSGGSISSTNGIQVIGGSLTATNNITSSAGAIDLETDSEEMFGNIIAGGNISAAGGLFTPGDPGMISAGGSISAPGVITGTLNAGTTITINNSQDNFSFGIIANTISAGGNLNLINVPTISPNNATSDGTIGFTPVDFSLTAANIISTGPTFPILSSNGSDSDPNVGNGNPGNGGNVTINITNAGLNVGPGDDLAQIIANGGAFATGAILGGNGGVIDITATEDVNVDGNITANTGVNPTGTPAGNGGTVNITTAGTVTVNSTIQTSGNGSGNTNSARGGHVSLTSSRATGVAINVSNSGQLLALLDQAAPGPGGTVTILATGASSEVDAKGTMRAERGTIDIRHTGNAGEIYVGGGPPDFLDAHANVLKVGALGSNGTLTVGASSLTADDTLKLYASGSNGQLNFIQNATLSSGSNTILAGSTITIQPSVVVTIAGNGGPAQVFTNNPNYSGFGGNNPSNGTFGGNGANNPLPLNQAPPFD